jgi:hypothetical protein
MSREQFIDSFDTTPKHALDMERKLSDALEVARSNRPDLMTR